MATATQPTAPQLADGLPPRVKRQTIPKLARRLLAQLSVLIRQELSLAWAELSQSLGSLLAAATSIVVAGVFLFAGVLLLLSAAVLGLTLVMPAWLAAVLVGAAMLLIGASLLGHGISRVRGTNVRPRLSGESLRKDKDVLTRRAPP